MKEGILGTRIRIPCSKALTCYSNKWYPFYSRPRAMDAWWRFRKYCIAYAYWYIDSVVYLRLIEGIIYTILYYLKKQYEMTCSVQHK